MGSSPHPTSGMRVARRTADSLQVNHFGDVSRLRNHKAIVSLKHNKTGFGGKPDNSSRPTFTAGAVTGLDEITKRQCFSLMIGFHGKKINKQFLTIDIKCNVP